MVIEGAPGDAAEVEAEFAAGRFATFGFEVRRSASGKAGAVVSFERGALTAGNARAYVGNSERYKVRLFLDKRCLEVYVNDGAVALYNWVDAAPQDRGFAIFARAATPPPGMAGGSGNSSQPSVRLESLKIWPMKPAQFSLERFHL